jgi:MFS family permease
MLLSRSKDSTVVAAFPSFFLLAAVFFFFFLGDTIMSYLSPVIMEQHLGSATAMGLLFSTSSMAGMVADFLFPKFFVGKTSRFFFRILFLVVFLFPLSFILSPNVLGFALGMIVWGIYYEAFSFARFHAVKETVLRKEYSWAWGNLSLIQNLARVIGPLLAGVLIDQGEVSALLAAIIAFVIALYLYVMYVYLGKKQQRTALNVPADSTRRSWTTELHIWKSYSRVLWPLFLYLFIFFLIESAFFTIGPILSEQLQFSGPFDGLLLSVYSLPGLFAGLLLPRLSKPYGKKRLSFLAGLIGASSLLFFAVVSSLWLILLIVFIAAIGLNIMYPALQATMEDYIKRSEHTENDLIGMTSMFISAGYVLGPILSGFLADLWSAQMVFALWGGVMAIYSLFLLCTVKRKIRLPQHELLTFSREQQ